MDDEKSFGLKQLMASLNKIWNILVLAHELPGGRFPAWRRPIPRQRLSCCQVK
jgi:hypothetical protein